MMMLLDFDHGLSSVEIISHALNLNIRKAGGGEGIFPKVVEMEYMNVLGFVMTTEVDLTYTARYSQKHNPG